MLVKRVFREAFFLNVRALVLGLTVLTGCRAATVPGFTLPNTVRPTHYRVDLRITPDQPNFDGEVQIDLQVREPISTVWLNARHLTIRSAELSGAKIIPLHVVQGDEETIGFAAAGPMAPGPARLTIRYAGPVEDRANDGVFRRLVNGDWYVFTTFTPIEARKAFPCFDEPKFKAPWQLTLHVPRSAVAVSNAPAELERDETKATKKVVFGTTTPLAPEVVAFAVGPFDVVNAGRAGRKQVPVRILTPRGMGADAESARSATADILARLEAYTGIPYPWEKLDHLALVKGAFGAVENPGLITYQEQILLAKPQQDTPERQNQMRRTMAHELAHQWFGNLVTQASWTDVWLSEGFATWLSMKVMNEEYPPFERNVADNLRSSAMSSEHLHPTWPVRREIHSRAEATSVYNSLVYAKGAAVLDTVEDWLGANAFQHGLQQYLTSHAHGNADVDDLAVALGRVSRKDVHAALHSLLDHPGIPAVQVSVNCRRAEVKAGDWTLPMCVHWDGGSRECVLLYPGTNEVSLKTESCPSWAWSNGTGRGYYHSRLAAEEWDAIRANGTNQLTSAEQRSLISDAGWEMTEGELTAPVVMQLLEKIGGGGDPRVAMEALRISGGLFNAVPEDRRSGYLDWMTELYGVSAVPVKQATGVREFLDQRGEQANKQAH